MVAFLTFLVRRVLPSVVELEGSSSLAALNEILMPGQQQRQQWCTLVALSEALMPDDADGEGSSKQPLLGDDDDEKAQQARSPSSLRESPQALAFVMQQLEEGFFSDGEGRGRRLRTVVRELVSG